MKGFYSAYKIDGWVSGWELLWLGLSAADHKKIIEIGAWKGRSTYMLAHYTKGKVYAVDNWSGPTNIMEHADGYKEILDKGPDFVYNQFCKNIEPVKNKVVIIRENSNVAFRTLEENYGKDFDMLFIDGDHQYFQIKADIENYMKLLKPGGLICGHDYPGYPGVYKAVNELFPGKIDNFEQIWSIREGGQFS